MKTNLRTIQIHGRRGPRRRSGRRARPRLAATTAAILLFAALVRGSAAVAVAPADIGRAEATYAALQDEIRALQGELDSLQTRGGRIAEEALQASSELEATRQQLIETRSRLERARSMYDERVELLEDRARDAFISGGPGSNIGFLLSSASLADLSDRLQFVDQVSASDADLASQVETLKAGLSRDARALERLRADQQAVYDALRQRELELEQQFALQQALIDDIEARKRDAARTIGRLKRERREQLAARYAASFGGEVPSGVFQACPVGQPRAFGDDFGASRYSGGYHLHAGNDILAPMGTPIYAPFDGTASDASNGLGGLSVYVHGEAGYVYNAHLSQLGQLGPVRAGDVIGYVGDSGNAQGGPPHDHFEWHPDAMPTSWPSSSYGHSSIGDALNPYPLLLQVC
jgi:peptidoglycan hydrolase CwlO-like protein